MVFTLEITPRLGMTNERRNQRLTGPGWTLRVFPTSHTISVHCVSSKSLISGLLENSKIRVFTLFVWISKEIVVLRSRLRVL